MPYDENTTEDTTETVSYSSDDTETITSSQIIKTDNLTDEEIANRIILQLQYNEDMERERNEQIIELLEKLVEQDTVSENDIHDKESAEDQDLDKSSEVFRLVEAPSSSDDTLMVDILTDIYNESVSQNSISNTGLLAKQIDDYNTTEGFCFFIAVVVLCLLLYTVLSKH